MNEQPERQRVVVTDVRMPFSSMVVFMVKWAIAAIPAFLILMVIGALAWGTLIGVIFSMASARQARRDVSSEPPTGAISSAAGSTATAEEAFYLPKMTVTGVTVEEASLGGKGVFGQVNNTGDRTLTKVQITIYYLDGGGKPISEKTYHPVLVSDFSMGDTGSPLKAGYSRRFGAKAGDAPSEWSGKVEVKVTEVEFAKS